jgi:uncharacterized protein YbjT (DUF2867 family)
MHNTMHDVMQDGMQDKASLPPEAATVLVTGATGYVGGRLVPRLLEEGYRVRVLARGGADRLRGRPWADEVEAVAGDALDPASLVPALEGVDAAYYLIHSMGGSGEFGERDRLSARNFGVVAAMQGVQRIIYLGGLGDPEANLSHHLRSRQETGEVLRASGVPVTEFRAGMVVGSGSLSFEMLRHLTERLPVMICPRWVFTRSQPIAVRDILQYLVGTLTVPESAGRIIEVGGPDVLTYADMMYAYARERRLKRWLIPVPALTPGLSSHWVHWMTPVPAGIASPLILGLRNELLVDDTAARELFPDIRPMGFQEAVRIALDRLRQGEIETIWSDALASSMGDLPPVLFTQEQGMLIERRQVGVDAPPEAVYRVFAGVGGRRGWPAYNWLWELRGVLDRMVGGVGMRRGRRHPDELREGDALDFWRVEQVQAGRSILLRAEMKTPGRAWLALEALPADDGRRTDLVQTAYFAPRGLFGLLYWYGIYPLHAAIFSRMVKNLAQSVPEAGGIRY